MEEVIAGCTQGDHGTDDRDPFPLLKTTIKGLPKNFSLKPGRATIVFFGAQGLLLR